MNHLHKTQILLILLLFWIDFCTSDLVIFTSYDLPWISSKFFFPNESFKNWHFGSFESFAPKNYLVPFGNSWAVKPRPKPQLSTFCPGKKYGHLVPIFISFLESKEKAFATHPFCFNACVATFYENCVSNKNSTKL